MIQFQPCNINGIMDVIAFFMTSLKSLFLFRCEGNNCVGHFSSYNSLKIFNGTSISTVTTSIPSIVTTSTPIISTPTVVTTLTIICTLIATIFITFFYISFFTASRLKGQMSALLKPAEMFCGVTAFSHAEWKS